MPVDKLEFFKSAEQEYIDFIQVIETNLARLDSAKDGKRADMISKIGKKIKQAQRSIQNMEMELNSVSNFQDRQRLSDRVSKYSQNLNAFERQLKEQKKNSERSALLAGSTDADFSTSDDHRARLAMSTDRLKETGKSLDTALRVLESTEVLGAETAMMTREQGDQMRRAKDRLAEINGDVSRGSRIIGRISRRQLTNKIILLAIIVVILLAIFLVVFFAIILPIILKFKGSDDKKEANTNSISIKLPNNQMQVESLADLSLKNLASTHDIVKRVHSQDSFQETLLTLEIPSISSPEALPVLKEDGALDAMQK